MEYNFLKQPKLGDVFKHKTANGWHEEASVISNQTYADVWKAVLLTSSEGVVFINSGNQVRDENDWSPKVGPENDKPPGKRSNTNSMTGRT